VQAIRNLHSRARDGGCAAGQDIYDKHRAGSHAEVAGEDALSGPPEADPGEETDIAPGIEPAGTRELVEINSREIARVARPSFEEGLAQALAWSRQPRVRKF
jgi:hypothetical protein